MPAQVDDTNYDIWLEHSSAKVPYRLARDENGNVMLSTGSAPFTAQQIYSGDFSLESINHNVDEVESFEKFHHGAGFSDYATPFGYNFSDGIDASWPDKLYLSPGQSASSSTTQSPIKFVNSSLGLFVMTTRYVLEWTGAAWTSRLDVGASNTNNDLIEFVDANGNVILVLGVSNAAYYTSTDGISWTQQGGSAGTMPAYRATAAATATAASSLSIAAPAGLVDNDIMIAAVSHSGYTEQINLPSGWTQLGQENLNSAGRVTYAWKRAASESGSYVFTTPTATPDWRGAISAYSGAITTGNPIEGSGFATNVSDSTPVTGSTTVATANTLAIVAFLTLPTESATATAPTDYTENYDTTSISFNGKTATPAVGSIGPITGALSAAVSSYGGLILLTTAAAATSSFTDIARFALRGQSNGSPLLWAVDSAGDFRNTPDPLTGSAWSAADATRLGAGVTIKGLEVVDNVFYLIHNKGITSYDGTTVATVWTNISLAQNTADARPYTWVDKSVYFTFNGSLYKYTADSLIIQKVWPRGPQAGNLDLSGTIVAINGNENNLYFMLENAAGSSYVMKCDPYFEVTIDDKTIMPVHPILPLAQTGIQAMHILPASSNTFSTDNPQIVYGYSTNSRYVFLPNVGMRPQDDSGCDFGPDGQLYTSWFHNGARTFNKFLNSVSVLTELVDADETVTLKYNTADDGSAYTSIGTYSTIGLNTTTFSTDIEYQRMSLLIDITSAVNTRSPRVAGVIAHSSLNPKRVRQWEMYIEIANDTEMLGGGDSRHGARYLDNHLFTGLTERVTFYDRLGNSFITKILDITSQVRGEDVDVYKVTLVQLV